MRIAVFSDVHANLVALQAVLADIANYDVDEKWFLGDMTGRGGKPAECVDLIRQSCDLVLAGNHDVAVDGRLGYFFGHTGSSNDPVALSQKFALSQLNEETLEWMRECPVQTSRYDIDMWHASIRDPVWEFVSDRVTAFSCLNLQKSDLGLVGHTHTPYCARIKDNVLKDFVPVHDQIVRLDNSKLLLNPGAVGCPQEGWDARAAWMLLELDDSSDKLVGTAQWRYLEYSNYDAYQQALDAGIETNLAAAVLGRRRRR